MIPSEITAFYDKYKTKLYNKALRITGDSYDAEEVAQDTVIKYLRTNTGGMSAQQIEAWLVKTCTRAAIDMLRIRKALKVKLMQYAADDSEEESQDAWDRFAGNEDPDTVVRKVKNAMMELPDGYRVVLSLLLFEGYDYAEAAQVLEVSESTVRSQYMRGKRKLIEVINKNKTE